MNRDLLRVLANPLLFRKGGFTLIELMIVIAIIAILAVVGITVYGNTQKAARDSRRQADIRSMAQAMEVSYNNSAGSYYPVAVGMFASGAIPKDPAAGAAYSGQTAATATAAGGYLSGNAFSFCATQEVASNQFCMKNQR